VRRARLGSQDWLRLATGFGCWEWTASTTRKYGKIRREGRNGRWTTAHRLSWELHFGSIPDGMCVCHRCDNPVCVRPDHLFLGTHADNAADRNAKGRASNVRAQGTKHHAAKLHDAAVREIRAADGDRMRLAEMAARFGVSASTVKSVLARRSWKHVQEAA
jgi:DNA-directed RNA polymerase specialized sigma24 family protein